MIISANDLENEPIYLRDPRTQSIMGACVRTTHLSGLAAGALGQSPRNSLIFCFMVWISQWDGTDFSRRWTPWNLQRNISIRDQWENSKQHKWMGHLLFARYYRAFRRNLWVWMPSLKCAKESDFQKCWVSALWDLSLFKVIHAGHPESSLVTSENLGLDLWNRERESPLYRGLSCYSKRDFQLSDLTSIWPH